METALAIHSHDTQANHDTSPQSVQPSLGSVIELRMLRLVFVRMFMLSSLGIISIGEKLKVREEKGRLFPLSNIILLEEGCSFRMELPKSSA